MKGIQITIGNEVFPTKKKATEKIRSIVNSKELITTSRRIEIDEYTTAYDCDPYSKPLKGEEHEFVNNLLKLHPDSKNKIGIGIDYFFIKEIYEYLYPKDPNFGILDIINWYDNVYIKRKK